MKNYLSNFSISFQNKLSRYRRWQDAQLSLLGRVLLMKGLEQFDQFFDQATLKYTSFNKPYIDGSDVHFNISHSGDIVVCALTKLGEIGIDIEKMNSINFSTFKPQMTDNEWQLIKNATNSKCSFYKYWSQKEAVIKAHGNGLSIPLKTFEVCDNMTTIRDEHFYLHELHISEKYSCHVAFRKCLKRINIKVSKVNF